MRSALLAWLLLAATVDPRLTEPLRLLAEVRGAVYGVTGEPIGPMLASRADSRLEAIARDLARLSPVVDSDLGDYCGMCGKVAGADVDLTVPEAHEQHCVWRRASELFPDPSG